MIWATSLSRKKNIPRTYYGYSPGSIFPSGITYSSRTAAKFHSDFNNPEGKPPARVRAILADCRNEAECSLLAKGKHAKAD